ncbi:MAG TPA: hypothetical protein PKZ43_05810 [Bacteroidales bacterium]|nr:hypothetical protein [Bacteroidales bacterium]HQI45461.1 hypothetical protein [Bacteroidales bacterium]
MVHLLDHYIYAFGIKSPYILPDYATKEKAQKLIGLEISKIIQQKEEFKKNVLPQWVKVHK